MGYKNCSMCLSDDLSDAEAIEIVKAELNKIDKSTLAGELASGNYNSLNLAIKNSVKQICVKGAIKQANNVYVWVGVAVAGLLIGYLIFK